MTTEYEHNQVFIEEVKILINVLLLNLFKTKIQQTFPQWQIFRICFESLRITELSVIQDNQIHQLPNTWKEDIGGFALNAILLFHSGTNSFDIQNNTL